jgi:hypothetical protein
LAPTNIYRAPTLFLASLYGNTNLVDETLATRPKRERKKFFGRDGDGGVRDEPAREAADCQTRAPAENRQEVQSALMRVASRDSLRDTVFLCITPLVIARCNSGRASWRADWAAPLSPPAIAVSTFLTKVRTRLIRERLIAVRFSVWRMRFSADLWFAMLACRITKDGLFISGLRMRQSRTAEKPAPNAPNNKRSLPACDHDIVLCRAVGRAMNREERDNRQGARSWRQSNMCM